MMTAEEQLSACASDGRLWSSVPATWFAHRPRPGSGCLCQPATQQVTYRGQCVGLGSTPAGPLTDTRVPALLQSYAQAFSTVY